jgi:hypothetical protein
MQLGIILYRAVRVGAAVGALALVSLKLASTCSGKTTSNEPRSAPALAPTQRTGAPDEVIDIAVGSEHACALRADGRVACWGELSLGTKPFENFWFKPKLIEGVADAVKIAAAADETCALTKAGEVKCWGSYYRFKNGTTTIPGISEEPTDLVLGTSSGNYARVFGCVLHARGRVSCWNHLPATNDPLNTDAILPPPRYQTIAQLVEGVTSAQKLMAAGPLVCARTSDTAATCWGDHNYYNAPAVDPTHVPIASPISHPPFPASVTTTLGSSTAPSCEHSRCWGVDLSRRTAIDINKALLAGADVAKGIPVRFPDACWINESAQLSCNEKKLDQLTATKVVVSQQLGCAIRTTGNVACWGPKGSPILADGHWYDSIVVPIRQASMAMVTHAVKNETFCTVGNSGTVKCSGKPFYSSRDRNVQNSSRAVVPDNLSPAASVSVGLNQACIVTSEGKVECWGGGDEADFRAQRGISHDVKRVVPNLTDVQRVEVGDASACAETKSGDVYCWGDADEFEAAKPEGSISIVDIQLP